MLSDGLGVACGLTLSSVLSGERQAVLYHRCGYQVFYYLRVSQLASVQLISEAYTQDLSISFLTQASTITTSQHIQVQCSLSHSKADVACLLNLHDHMQLLQLSDLAILLSAAWLDGGRRDDVDIVFRHGIHYPLTYLHLL